MDRLCRKCKQIKDENEFTIRYKATGERKIYCKPCEKAYNQMRYKLFGVHLKKRVQEYQAKNREKYIAYQDKYNDTVRKEKKGKKIDFWAAEPPEPTENKPEIPT